MPDYWKCAVWIIGREVVRDVILSIVYNPFQVLVVPRFSAGFCKW